MSAAATPSGQHPVSSRPGAPSPGLIQPASPAEERWGLLLVFLSALFWSFGGMIARFVEVADVWTVVFWRSFWASLFLIGFMMMRDGVRGTVAMVRAMGLAGIAVGVCFAVASSSFVIAISHTTVANVVLMQAGVPLIAALMTFLLFGERVSASTWVAIAAVIIGVAVMVSESFDGKVSPLGDGLALLIAFAFSTATVITRRFSHVRMTPATCLGTLFACAFASTRAGTYSVSGVDMAWLFAFGALNLGLGLACFAMGARLIPAAFAALLGTFETLLAPVWVWLVHGEVPSGRTVIGGAIIFVALLVHIALQFRRMSAPQRPGITGIPAPN